MFKILSQAVRMDASSMQYRYVKVKKCLIYVSFAAQP